MLGETVGTYRLDRKLGEGGMGMVYSATHTVLGKLAAVKLMRPHLCADEESVARFFNEAVLTASIRHPGIVEIFDYGFHEPSGSAFISMALLEGESLEDRLEQRRKLPLVDALRITQQIASALAAAHDAGVVHRDLKPDNVFLTPDPDLPGGERIQLLDFGIAKLVDDGEQATSLTQTGTMIGTPLYMSPEQCRGRGDIDGRTDLYAIGCMLYQMLSGVPPFAGATPLEVAAGHLRDEPKPLAKRVRRLPAPVAALVHELLAKEPDDRPASAAVLHRRLGKLLATVDTVRGHARGALLDDDGGADETRGDIGSAETIATGAGPARSRRLAPALIALVAAGGLAAGLFAVRATRGGDARLAVPVTLPGDCGGLEPEPCRRAAWVVANGEVGPIDRRGAEAMFREACAAGSFAACSDAVAVDRRYLFPQLEPHLGDPSAPFQAHLVIDYSLKHLGDFIEKAWAPLRERFPGDLSLTLLPSAQDGPRGVAAARAACAAHRQRQLGQFVKFHDLIVDQNWNAERVRNMTWSRGVDVDRLVADYMERCEREVVDLRTLLYDQEIETGTLIVAGRLVPPPHDLELVEHFIEEHRAEMNGARASRIAATQRPIVAVRRYPIAATGPPAPVTVTIVCDPAVQRCEMIREIAEMEAKASGARVNNLLIAGDSDLAARTLCAARRLEVGEPVAKVLAQAVREPPFSEAAVRAAAVEAGARWSRFVAERDGPCKTEVAEATRVMSDANAPTSVGVFVNGRPSRLIGTPSQALIREELALAELYGYGTRIPAERYYQWLLDGAGQ